MITTNTRFLLVSLLVALSLLAVFAPVPVYADSETDYVEGAGTYANCDASGDAPNWHCVDEVGAADDGTTYVYVYDPGCYGSVTEYDTYEHGEFTAAASEINSVTLYFRCDGGSSLYTAETAYGVLRINGLNYYGAAKDLGSSWADYSQVWYTNPAGGDWEADDINDMEIGIRLVANGNCYYPVASTAKCSQVYMVVDYEPATVPGVTATAPTTYDDTTATLIGTITSDGGLTLDNYGFVWATSDYGDPGNLAPADAVGGWTKGWAIGAGTYNETTYTHGITSLTKNTQYYIRFAAHNSLGWEYSSAVSFTTIKDPTISTVAATEVGSTTATINALVTDDGKIGGGEDCTVTFAFKEGTYADYAALVAASANETAADGYYNTNDYPYLELTGLSTSANYTFATKIVNCTATPAYGVAMYFATSSGVGTPSNAVAIPSSTTCSLSWVKGAGSPNTLVRYKTGSYPAATGEGTYGYLGTGNSVSVASLTIGTTYYVSLWGYDSGVYSDNYTTVMFTTLAAGSSTATELDVPADTSTTTTWNQEPSDTKISAVPYIGSVLEQNSDAYGTPVNWMGYLGTIIVAVIVGITIYARAGHNSVLSAAAALCILGIGAVSMELVMLWIVVFILIIYIGVTMYGERR